MIMKDIIIVLLVIVLPVIGMTVSLWKLHRVNKWDRRFKSVAHECDIAILHAKSARTTEDFEARLARADELLETMRAINMEQA